MTFYQHPDKHRPNSGFCDCDDIVEVKSLIPGCEGVERPLIYHREDDRCYTVFSQVNFPINLSLRYHSALY
jgi:hypothetical protein